VELIKYGIIEEGDLIRVSGNPRNKRDSRGALHEEGILPVICDMLFQKYVAQHNYPGAAETILPAFFVGATVRGAKQYHGAQGNVCKFLGAAHWPLLSARRHSDTLQKSG